MTARKEHSKCIQKSDVAAVIFKINYEYSLDSQLNRPRHVTKKNAGRKLLRIPLFDSSATMIAWPSWLTPALACEIIAGVFSVASLVLALAFTTIIVVKVCDPE